MVGYFMKNVAREALNWGTYSRVCIGNRCTSAILVGKFLFLLLQCLDLLFDIVNPPLGNG